MKHQADYNDLDGVKIGITVKNPGHYRKVQKIYNSGWISVNSKQ
jgi:hypothetical protein